MNTGTGKKAVAYHEAGHAVIARVLGVEVAHVSVEECHVPTFSAYYLVKDVDFLAPRLAAIETDCKVSLAGPHAQTRYAHHRGLRFNRHRAVREEWQDDHDSANACVGTAIILKQEGRATPGEYVTLSDTQAAEAGAMFNRLSAETSELVRQHWSTIERVAGVLAVNKFLSPAELDALMA